MGAVSILLLALLLAFPGISIEGASNGLLLWYQVVLPTLSPFMICTQLVVALGGVGILMKPFYPLLRRVFGFSLPGAYIMLCGLLCGYPLGAKMCSDFYSEGKISHEEASYLLAVCNHPSPMFLLGYVRSQLPQAVPAGLLFACLYLPVLPLSLLAGYYYGYRKAGKVRQREHEKETVQAARPADGGKKAAEKRRSLEDMIASTSETMVLIGGYIMLFSILAAWITHLNHIPPAVKAVLTGFAEITSGVHQICTILPAEDTLLFVIAAVAFGGLSGIFQTKSVIKNAVLPGGAAASQEKITSDTKKNPEHNSSGRRSGLSIRHYVIWKILHAVLSCLILILLSQSLPRQLRKCWQIIHCGWRQ